LVLVFFFPEVLVLGLGVASAGLGVVVLGAAAGVVALGVAALGAVFLITFLVSI
jgi:hypothetical protein